MKALADVGASQQTCSGCHMSGSLPPNDGMQSTDNMMSRAPVRAGECIHMCAWVYPNYQMCARERGAYRRLMPSVTFSSQSLHTSPPPPPPPIITDEQEVIQACNVSNVVSSTDWIMHVVRYGMVYRRRQRDRWRPPRRKQKPCSRRHQSGWTSWLQSCSWSRASVRRLRHEHRVL